MNKAFYFMRSVCGLLVLSAAVLTAQNTASPVQVITDFPGVAIENGNQMTVALALINSSDDTGATSLTVSSVTLTLGSRLSPTTFPVSLGSFSAGQRAVVNARFLLSTVSTSQRYVITVTGTYTVAGRVYGYQADRPLTLPPPAPGSAVLGTGFVVPLRAIGGPFTPQAPAEDNEQNPQGRPVPIGVNRFVFGATPTQARVVDFSALANLPGPVPQGSSTVAFVKNTFVTGGGFPPDPSAASSGDVVISSANTFLKISTDAGKTFTQYSPSSIYSDNPDGGLCCDQVIHYVPSIDRFIWLIQTSRAKLPTDTAATGNTGPSRERVAVASPAAIKNNVYSAWTYWDLTPGLFGLPTNTFLDYPDLAVGNNYLYISEDQVGTGLEVARIPLSQLRDAVTAEVDFTDPSKSGMAYASHLSQNAGDAVYWAGHNSTSSMRIFHMAEGSNQYNWNDINVDSWQNSDYTSKAADGQYWLPGPLGASVIGVTRKPFFGLVAPGSPTPNGEVWFAWPAGRDAANGRPQPYVEIVSVDDQTLKQTGRHQIWNSNYAFSYPALATDITNSDIAISLASGGNSAYYGNNFVGFWGDFVVYQTTNSDVTLTSSPPSSTCPDVSGGATPKRCSRFGDYYSVRPVPQQRGIFSTLGYSVTLVNPKLSTDCLVQPGCKIDLHYVEFGRYGSVFPPPPLK